MNDVKTLLRVFTKHLYNALGYLQAYCAPVEPITLLKLTGGLLPPGGTHQAWDKLAPFSTTSRADMTPRGILEERDRHICWVAESLA